MADYYVTVPFTYVLHLLNDFVQIAYSNAQNVENAWEWPFDIMKHRFIYFIKVVFQDVQDADCFLDHSPN
jgi:hypothetical protein